MKLITRYTRLNLIATVLIFLAGSCTFYFLLRYIIISELDETLYTEQQEIAVYVKEHHTLPEILPTKDQYITYSPTSISEPVRFRNVHKLHGKEEDAFREITFTIDVSGKKYFITVSKPLEETEDLMQLIILVTIGMIGLILFAGYVINRKLLNSLWKPFYQTIDQVKRYKISDKTVPQLGTTDIDEFALLNQSILHMTERVQADYQSLKEFTSHAAHEMQTPLSVIRIKLDMLMQNEYLLQHSPAQIPDIEKAVHKLSRLYQALLLLTKVENRQFILNEKVAVNEIIQDKYLELSEMLEARDLDAIINIRPFEIIFHRQLTEIIISNLLYNAIRYNMPGGEIDIQLEENVFTVSNTSLLPQLDIQRVFQRFYRHADVKEDGNGLGLSIVQQICDMAGFIPLYAYENERHIFSVSFM
ncbi:sensor histidine kinase [Chitinophagaceae bacterium MMS25-I14]